MLESIITCQRCALHLWQEPLLDFPQKSAIMLVGLSAKQISTAFEVPLDNHTKSGQLVSLMEKIAIQYDLKIYRTNLVKCPPLDSHKKLRYPTQDEIDICFENILYEIDTLQPKIVILLGNIVRSTFNKKLNLKIEIGKNCTFSFLQLNGRCYLASYHPSYIMRSNFRREQYLKNFSALLAKFSCAEGDFNYDVLSGN